MKTMADFYISKIIATASDGRESFVDFSRGLNIVCGQPNTGKSCIFRCINFLFGTMGEKGDKTYGSPFSKANTGYDCVRMIVKVLKEVEVEETDADGNKQTATRTIEKEVSLRREIGTKIINVISDVGDIESGVYDVKNGTKKNGYKVINDVWLTLLGVEGTPEIFSVQDFSKRQKFSWNVIKQMFLVSEKRIISQTPILFPEKSVFNETQSLASLVHLLTGRDYNEIDPKESKNSRAMRRKAVNDYIFERMEALRNRKTELAQSIDVEDDSQLEKAIARIFEELAEIERRMLEAADLSKHLLDEIVEEETRLSEAAVMLGRYKVLRGQYESDVKRLRFISNGEKHIKGKPHSAKCPFCDGDIPLKEQPAFLESAKIEIAQIQAKLKDLTAAENDSAKEKAEAETAIERLTRRKSEIETLIQYELNPQKNALKEKQDKFRAALLIRGELDSIDRIVKDMDGRIRDNSIEEQEDKQPAPKFLPKEYVTGEFLETIDEYLKASLTECDYGNFVSARFDLDRFDIEVDGRAKIETNFGKGYIAYLNTVMGFALMKYLKLHAKYAPGMFIADSPTLSFRKYGDACVATRMKNGMYRFLLNNQQYGQVIIFENEIADIPLPGVNLIEFSKDLNEGRYGFLEGVIDPNTERTNL
jgi:hypothetical protein